LGEKLKARFTKQPVKPTRFSGGMVRRCSPQA